MALAQFEQKVGKGVTTFLTYGIGAVMVLARVIWQGWCAALLWQWYVVPVFSVPPIDLWQAAGLVLVLAIFGLRLPLSGEKEASTKRWVFLWFTAPAVVLAVGYLLKVIQ